MKWIWNYGGLQIWEECTCWHRWIGKLVVKSGTIKFWRVWKLGKHNKTYWPTKSPSNPLKNALHKMRSAAWICLADDGIVWMWILDAFCVLQQYSQFPSGFSVFTPLHPLPYTCCFLAVLWKCRVAQIWQFFLKRMFPSNYCIL